MQQTTTTQTTREAAYKAGKAAMACEWAAAGLFAKLAALANNYTDAAADAASFEIKACQGLIASKEAEHRAFSRYFRRADQMSSAAKAALNGLLRSRQTFSFEEEYPE
jgi:hypothetical protein